LEKLELRVPQAEDEAVVQLDVLFNISNV